MLYCKYCKKPLEEESDIQNEYHASCHEEILDYQQDQSPYGKKLFYLTQLKEHLTDKELKEGRSVFLGFYYLKTNILNEYYKYLIIYQHNDILRDIGVLIESYKGDEPYYQDFELIIEYETTTLELPEFFEHIPSLKLIIIYLHVNGSEKIENKIPESLRSKCLINLLIEGSYNLSKIKNIFFSGLVFHIENQFFIDLDKEFSSSLVQEYNIDEYLVDYLTILPNEIERTKSFYCKKLTFINEMIDNLPTDQIEYITGDIDLFDYTKLKNLKHLYLRNVFKIDSVFNSQHLISLELKFDLRRYGSLNDAFWRLKSLQYLKITSLHLPSFPESIRCLKNLQIFILHNCNLKSIPEWLGELDNLVVLSLTGNRITSFPIQILEKLKKLKYLKLRPKWSEEKLLEFKLVLSTKYSQIDTYIC